MGFLLVFVMISTVSIAVILSFNNSIEERKNDAAALYAESIASYIADSMVYAVTTYLNSPDSNYEKLIEIPDNIIGKSYYVELSEDKIYVNTTDGQVSEYCTSYEAKLYGISCSGRVYSGKDKLKISRYKTEDVFKLDFGTSTSPVGMGYFGVTSDNPSGWGADYSDYPYRTRILLNNSVRSFSSEAINKVLLPKDLTQIPVTVTLNLNNFNFLHANVTYIDDTHEEVLSDLVFINSKDGSKLEYYVETWNPFYESNIIVLIPRIDVNESFIIYMYHGYNGDLTENPHDYVHGIIDVSEDANYFNIGGDGDNYDMYREINKTDGRVSSGIIIDGPAPKPERVMPGSYNIDPTGEIELADLPQNSSEKRYIFETKVNFFPTGNAGESNLEFLLLNNSLSAWKYNFYSLNITNSDPYNISSYKTYYNTTLKQVKTIFYTGQNISFLNDRWIKLKSFIWVNSTVYSGYDLINDIQLDFFLNFTVIQTVMRDFYTDQLAGSISFFDMSSSWNNPDLDVFLGGSIDYHCGSDKEGHNDQYALIDWASLRTWSNPSPHVYVEYTESNASLWENPTDISSFDCGDNQPGNVLRDNNYGTTQQGRLKLSNLAAGYYTIGVNFGDNTTARDNLYVNIDINGGTYDEILSDIDTEISEFKEETFTVYLENFGDITLIFGDESTVSPYSPGWAVCSVTLEKGLREINIAQET